MSIIEHSMNDLIMPDSQSDAFYNPDTIFHEDGPLNPNFIADAIHALMRAMPLDTAEPGAVQHRHMDAALVALAATNPRDPIEVMLAVQAISAYQAACACWRIGMNLRSPRGDSTRHISAAATAARTFDSMLRAMERRQAKPLSVPVGRPVSKVWADDKAAVSLERMAERIRRDTETPIEAPADVPKDVPVNAPVNTQAEELRERSAPAEADSGKSINQSPTPLSWSAESLEIARQLREADQFDEENAGLDLANTTGILPGGGMIMPEEPTPQQAAYVARRLGLMYKREYADNLRKGHKLYPKIRPIRTGDFIP
jgi:hypothetical protein